MAKNKPTKVISKKHLARLERERRQTTAILYTAIGILVIIVIMIAYGIMNETGFLTSTILAGQPVEKVNNDAITTHEFQLRVRITRQSMIGQYFYYYQLAQMFGSDPTSDPTISNYLQQIQSQLDSPLTIGTQALNSAANNLIIRQYAAQHGIVVTDLDIDKAVQEAFNYHPNGTPTTTPTATPFTIPTLSTTQLALVTLTYTPTPLPTGTPLPTPTADLSATPTALSTATASPTPYTQAGFQADYQKALDYYKKIGMNESEFRRIFFEDKLYQQRVEDAITADMKPEQEQVWARHILVLDEATARKVRILLTSGEDWSTVAATFSTDTASKNSGGDLGWFGRGKMVAEFENVAFALPVGEISQPVQSTDGWHIIQVLGHEDRPLTADEFKTVRDTEFQNWLAQQTKGANIKLYDYWTNRIPVQPSLQDTFTSMYKTQTAIAK